MSIFGEKHYYHLYSEGRQEEVLFESNSEFVDGMNLVGTVACKTGIRVMAFCLMNTHFHFVVHGSEEDVEEFASKVSQMYMLRRKSWDMCGVEPVRIDWNAKLLSENEYLQTAIGYVVRNSMEITNKIAVTDYPWSSAGLYFRGREFWQYVKGRYRKAGEYTVRELYRILGSRVVIPDNWLIVNDSYIWPGNYVDITGCEGIFGSYSSFMFFVIAKAKRNADEFRCYNSRILMPDTEVREVARSIADELYGLRDLRSLDLEKRKAVALQLVSRLGCKEKQIERVMHLKKG